MPSQIELLKKSIARLEAKSLPPATDGTENPLLKGLKQQLVSETMQRDKSKETQERYSVAMARQSKEPKRSEEDK